MEDIQQYIEMVKKEFHQYMSLIFENKYDKNIVKNFFDEYISVRYFDMNKNIKDRKELPKAVLDELDTVAKKLVKVYDEKDVENIKEVFSYIMYFDNVGKSEKVIDKICEFRNEKLGIKSGAAFSKKLLKEVNSRKEQKEEYMKKLLGEFFKLKTKKTDKKEVQLVTLAQNISFPSSINSKIVNQIFNTGITAEDKLVVEYHMINAMIIQDIVKGDFYKKYIVEFTNTLLNKKSKLEKTLKIISNEFQKERIGLLVEYKDLTEDVRSKIYDLIRQGFNIAIKLDDTFNFEENEIKKLNVFSYIIIADKQESKLKKYKELKDKILKV